MRWHMRITRQDLDALLHELDCQVFYNHTTRKDNPKFPYIVYLELDTNNFVADNRVYRTRTNYLLVVHTPNRDDEINEKVMKLLTDNSIPYEVNGVDWDNSDLYYAISYSFQL